MHNTQLEVGAGDRLRTELEALPGVHRAIVAGPPWQAYLVCDADTSPVPVQVAAAAVLTEAGFPPGEVELNIAYLAGTGTERRVRFHESRLDHPRVGLARATVSLEWAGSVHSGEDEGEGGAPGELRVSAKGTLRALEAVLDGTLTFDLLGIKAMRVFDHDLVAVLVRCHEEPERRLIGVSLVADDVCRAASLAVLNATNRLLGNYLVAVD